MSNLPQQETIFQYTADGVNFIFNYDCLVPLDTDIKVYLTPSGQPAIPDADIQILNVDYTVQDAGVLNGGTITFLEVPLVGSIITLIRDVQAAIDTNYVAAQTITGQNLDNSFQREMLVAQQNKNNFLGRGLKYVRNSYLPLPESETELPVLTTVDNQIWKSQNGVIIATILDENPVCSTLRTDLANETPIGNGASLIGYYDIYNDNPTTVDDFLNTALPNIQPNAYGAQVKNANPQTIDTVTTAIISIDTAVFDPNGLLNIGGNRLIAKKPGWYFVTVNFAYNVPTGSLTGGSVQMGILKNGAILTPVELTPYYDVIAANDLLFTSTIPIQLSLNDYIQFQVVNSMDQDLSFLSSNFYMFLLGN